MARAALEQQQRITDFGELVDALISFGEDHGDLAQWEMLFKSVLLNWGFNAIACNALFEQGREGYNWVKLHQSDAERNLSVDVRKLQFWQEVYYASDRMSIDRLMRCHWLYNAIGFTTPSRGAGMARVALESDVYMPATQELDGVIYHAVKAHDNCDGCFTTYGSSNCLAMHGCSSLDRDDCFDVVWIRKDA